MHIESINRFKTNLRIYSFIWISILVSAIFICLPFFDNNNLAAWVNALTTLTNSSPALQNSSWPGGPFFLSIFVPLGYFYILTGYSLYHTAILLKIILFVFTILTGYLSYKIAERINPKYSKFTFLFIMTNTEVFEDVGGYDENYFLELADLAFCRRVLKKDYSIIRLNKILISQTFGLTVSEKYPMISAFNFISSISSRIRLRKNSSNVYRTRYPVYGEVRLNQYYENYSKLTESNGISEIQSKLYLFILKKINCYLKRKIKETR